MNEPKRDQNVVQWRVEEGVGHIVLNRPEAANALDSACGHALVEAIAQARRGDSAFDHDLRTHLELEREALLRCAVSAQGREGVSAFVEKRAPDFVSPRPD